MGAMAKITQAQVLIITVVLTLIAGAVIFFTLIKPTQEAHAEADVKWEAADTTANKMPAAKKDRAKALAEVAQAKSDWAVYDRRFMPDINIGNLLYGTQQLWREQIQVLGPKTEKFLNDDKTVRVLNPKPFSLPAPSTDPNAVAKKSFVFPMGSVSVSGTFNNVLNHTTRWNKFDRLVLVDGLTLSGNSPALVGTYTLTAFIFTHGDTAGTPIPQAAAPAGGGFGGGGFGGGAPGGFGGGPPGGFGGDTGRPSPDGAGL